ncbi:DUF2169 family type VI secretion system accessory protein [Chondromyces apiculatus]|uniref:DUF2169 domain-containing protein n=1 Tax=Chondromyces apiculatus DSM 436 TaxID=1192034 RepID=A0A017T8C3_9BACT|nr:DUF2169 domain-containing protein [Chondromyces apiculatus]EYF05503.1 Hypothetical protein CAP_3231 [Chondromyces apiculatus DSM 436]
MRVIKPQRLSVLQRVFEIRQERFLALGLTAYLPFDAPELPLPEVAMWQEIPKQLGKDVALDEVLPKPRGEVLVFGKAFAPGGQPRPVFRARVLVGGLEKVVFVVGKRRWVRGVPSEPEPLTELTLGWDKAFGGPGYAANLAGMGIAPVEVQGEKVHLLPQVEDPRHLLKSPNDRPPPAGFGLLDPTAPERSTKSGTYDAAWLENEFPGFARDLDPEFFMVAPLDQRLPGFFQGGEAIEVEHLHPEAAILKSHVPHLTARCFIARGTEAGALEEVSTRLDTLVLLPNIRRMVAIFRGVARIETDDAADVKCLLGAFEHRKAPRPVEHYQAIHAQRLDKKQGLLVALRDRDLLPEVDPAAPALPDETISDMGDLLQREGVFERRSRERAQRELDQARLSVRALGKDPDELGIAREVPPAEAPPKLDELPEYMAQVEQEANRIEAEAKAKQEESLAQARQKLAEHGLDLDEVLERAKKEGGGPPKFRADEHLDRMRETAATARELGAPIEAFEAQIEDPAFIAKLRKLEEAGLVSYRTLAHHMTPAGALPDEAREALRRRVSEARAAGTSMTGWDLTGADLSGLDLSRASLKEALLEGADLRGCSLASADLTGAVLVRANVEGVRFAGADLQGANLGEILARGADFEGARLEKAVLYRGELAQAKFRGADLRGADLFEARLPGADLTGVIAEEVFFYECDLEGAVFDRARLPKATLLRCRMAGASFAEAILEGTGAVEVQARGASFRGVRARNLRLVLVCDLGKADFSDAELGSSTLRGVLLPGANLARIQAEGCDLSESDLRGAKLTGANLKGARLMRTDLTEADLSDTNLMEAMLQNAKTAGASFQRANLFRANLMGAVGDTRTSFQGAHVVRTLFPRRRS